ncbi:calcium homeostasis modulator protein 2 [Boleophthalmus pectinirostris]|uniref:calcium homeostasis modulator protein 2 n=1 Tax=Boleophthalmus pectinirostris TaxID=150288 RepID=UPI00242A9983|nr:calcium homeostasis modulator protein 2 [Boleophthalmus pectinirostris]
MAAAALVTENFKFVSLFFKSKDVMIFNGLVALGTVAGQTAYTVFAFDCPCSSQRNYYYGLAAIGVPALVLFLVGIMLNRNTWDLLAECQLRRCRKLSATAGFTVLASVLGRAVVAPLTWAVLSLLQGQAYTCALSEFVDPSFVPGFPSGKDPQVLAQLPCEDSVSAELKPFWRDIQRHLKYQSQLIGWLLVALMSVTVFLLQCMRRCCSPLGHQQEEYWSQYRAAEQTLFQNTAAAHAQLVAMQNVKNFFGFVSLEPQQKELLGEQPNGRPVCSTDWNRVTGVCLYREKNGLPLYSRIHKSKIRGPENCECTREEARVHIDAERTDQDLSVQKRDQDPNHWSQQRPLQHG